MRLVGTLTKWNDDRGFGFVTLDESGDDVFVHISAFPKDGNRPRVGEPLSFEVEVDGQGRKRARYVFCPERESQARMRDKPVTHYVRRTNRPSLLGRVIPLFALVALAVTAYGVLRSTTNTEPEAASISQPVYSKPLPVSDATARRALRNDPSPYRCDGRTRCSQMRSCAEATFFLRNCPNVQMDGDGDGVPCERQWC